jgi:hypothetical protein
LLIDSTGFAMPLSQDSNFLEKLVAWIHYSLDPSSVVKWNDVIDGRQFDATVRFEQALYKYFIAIECKDKSRPVSVDQIDAFVTKGRDVGASKLAFFSSSGFQSGALKVAQRHNVDLREIRYSKSVPQLIRETPGSQLDTRGEAEKITRIVFHYTGMIPVTFEGSSSEMQYYASHTKVIEQDRQRTLQDILASANLPNLTKEPSEYSISLDAKLLPPDELRFPAGKISRLQFRALLVDTQFVSGIGLDPSSYVPDIEIVDSATGDIQTISQYFLRKGPGTVFEVGAFYKQYFPDRFFYCESISDGLARLFLVETFQHGKLLQAEMEVRLEYSDRHEKLPENSPDISRLKRRLEKLKSKSSKANPPR